MTHDLHALSAPYALHALDAHERARFESHLEQCETCRRELAGFQATAARLAEAAEEAPPTGLRDRLMAEITTRRQEPPLVTSLSQHQRLRTLAPRLAVAASVLVAAGSVGGFLYERDRAEELQAQQVGVSEVMTADDAAYRAGEAATGGNVRVVMSPSKDAAVVVGAGLETLGEDQDYQVWTMHDGVARSVGLLSRDSGTAYVAQMKKADAVAITIEPAGGSESPTTEPIIALDT